MIYRLAPKLGVTTEKSNMNIAMIYYTGTYNTRFVTNLIAKLFRESGDTVTTVVINRDTKPVDLTAYDLVGFGYPIYGFNSPLPFNRYFKKLKIPKGKKCFIYKNSGETWALNNSSSRILKRILRRRHAQLVGEYHFPMPYNIHFPYDRDLVRELIEQANKLALIVHYNLTHGRIKIIKSNFAYDAAAWAVSIQKAGGAINAPFYRVDYDKCVKCNRCVNNCPEHNITVRKNGKLHFGTRCDMCMRCSFYCPTDAMTIGFLNGWRVNGDYRLEATAREPMPAEPYITEDTKGFYSCLIPTYAEINAAYDEVCALLKAENKEGE